jgi:hypothetical protein
MYFQKPDLVIFRQTEEMGFEATCDPLSLTRKLRARNRSNLPRKTSSLGTMGEEDKRREGEQARGTESEGLSPLQKTPFALQWRSKP